MSNIALNECKKCAWSQATVIFSCHAKKELQIFEFLQMAIEAHKWATVLVHEYEFSNFIKCMTCSFESGTKVALWFLKHQKYLKFSWNTFPIINTHSAIYQSQAEKNPTDTFSQGLLQGKLSW